MNEEDQLLLTIPSTRGTEVRLILKSYMNRPYIDLREFYPAKDGTMRPNRKGIILHAEDWEQIVQAVNALEIEYEDFPDNLAPADPDDPAQWFPPQR